MKSTYFKFFKLIISVAVCLSVGFFSGVATASAIPGWYNTINKPAFTPPGWIFGPVWTLLYIMMGVSLFLVWSSKKKKNSVYIFFGIQLLLNFLWSIIFFGMKLPLLAFIDIIFLWFAIFVTIKKFKNISPAAGYLLIPYLLWVSFASVLNFYIAILN